MIEVQMHSFMCRYAQSTPIWRHFAISNDSTMRMEDKPPERLCLKEELLQHRTDGAMSRVVLKLAQAELLSRPE